MADAGDNPGSGPNKTTSEMDKNPRDEDMLDLVKRRTKEIYKLKTGRASETRTSYESERGSLERDAGNSGPVQTGSDDSGNGITLMGLWEKVTSMADQNQKQIQSQTEFLANLAANVLAVQDKLKTNANTGKNKTDNTVNTVNEHSKPGTATNKTSSSPIYEDISESDGDDDIDEVMTDSSSSSDDEFLNDLEKEYETPNQFGEKIGEKLAAVAEKAVHKAIGPDEFKKLTDRYLVPENCKSLCVPKINKEVWRSFRSKRQREPDLALQSVEKCISSALVMVLKALELLKGKASQEDVKAVTKDMFKMLSHGLYTANRKRKLLITPGIPYKYRKVVDVEVKHTEFLFGDNLESKVDDIEKEEKRASKLSNDSFLERRKVGNSKFPHLPKSSKYLSNKKSKGFGQWKGKTTLGKSQQKSSLKHKKQQN